MEFADITNGDAPPLVKVLSAEPDEIVVVVGPRVPCGRDEKKCQKSVVRYRFQRSDLTNAELAGRSVVRDVAVPSGDSYVRVEWYSDSGDANSGSDKYFDNRVWDFGAFTSPIFVQGPAPTPALRSAQAAGVTTTTQVVVVDMYGRPVSGAQVVFEDVDLTGSVTTSTVNTQTTDAAGTVAALLFDGDHLATVTKAGCTGPGNLVPVVSPAFNVPVDAPVPVVLDCKDPDRTKPSVSTLSGPLEITPSNTATFTFTASDNSGKVRTGCMLDQVDLDEFAVESCTSPITFENVGGGQHTFSVISIDPNGNASTVSSRTFFVTTQATAPPLYRARQVPQGNGNAAPNVVVERNVARGGLGDADPDGDGWAVLGETQSANERGYLEAFEVSSTGTPTIIIDLNKPPQGARCYAATVNLAKVTAGNRRISITQDPTAHPDCLPDSKSDATPVNGPVYR